MRRPTSAPAATDLTVTDATAPTVICPAPTSRQRRDQLPGAVPDVLGAYATDSCSGTNGNHFESVTGGRDAGRDGVHTITVTATDAAP